MEALHPETAAGERLLRFLQRFEGVMQTFEMMQRTCAPTSVRFARFVLFCQLYSNF